MFEGDGVKNQALAMSTSYLAMSALIEAQYGEACRHTGIHTCHTHTHTHNIET